MKCLRSKKEKKALIMSKSWGPIIINTRPKTLLGSQSISQTRWQYLHHVLGSWSRALEHIRQPLPCLPRRCCPCQNWSRRDSRRSPHCNWGRLQAIECSRTGRRRRSRAWRLWCFQCHGNLANSWACRADTSFDNEFHDPRLNSSANSFRPVGNALQAASGGWTSTC